MMAIAPDEAKKLLTTYALLGKFFKSPHPPKNKEEDEKFAIYCLGSLVETGKERWLEAIKEKRIPLSRVDVDSLITKLLGWIDYEFYRDPLFTMSLRMAVFSIAGQEDVLRSMHFLHERLSKIFPDMLATEILEYTRDMLTRDARAGRELLPTHEEFNIYMQERIRFTEAYQTTVESRTEKRRKIPDYRADGTKTWFENCPKCGNQKRCDAGMRRFRCKQCGFDQPYPFQT